MLGPGLLLCAPALAKPPRPLFADDMMLELTIRAPVRTLVRNRADTETAVAGTLVVHGAAGESLPITLGLRGNRRRDAATCTFPPLSIGFPEKPGKTSLFSGQKQLKLVTHCRAAPAFQQHVLLEYAAYRIYGAMTDASFRARLATISYEDGDGKPITSRVGFLLEPIDDVARRAGQRSYRSREKLGVAQFDPAAATRMALFQEMIGNLDWSMTAGPPGDLCCHNNRAIAAKGQSAGLVPVPYDFDYSGLVNAPYAVPPAIYRLANVRQRRFRGFCRHNAAIAPVAGAILAKREALLTELAAVPMLEPQTARRAAAYLEEWFASAAGRTDADYARICE